MPFRQVIGSIREQPCSRRMIPTDHTLPCDIAESRHFPSDKSALHRYRSGMTLVRATYFFWYFSNGSRWQPEGRV